MTRAILKLFFLAAMVVAGAFAILYYREHPRVDAEKQQLLDANKQLKLVVSRLTDERRVAQLLVTDKKDVGGVTRTTLLFVEFGRDNTPMAPREFVIDGEEVHLDALVVKFDHYLVENDDALRGHSLALFTRIYGDHQAPVSGTAIDAPGAIPDAYQADESSAARAFENGLWQNFWKLAQDSEYAKSQGVRVANGNSNFWIARPGEMYTVTIESSGGLNLAVEPLKGIYAEALKRKP